MILLYWLSKTLFANEIINAACSISAGFAWGILNFYYLKQLIQSLCLNLAENPFSVLKNAVFKFPLLYLAGYFLLASSLFSPLGLLIGFSLALIRSTIVQMINLKNEENQCVANTKKPLLSKFNSKAPTESEKRFSEQ